MFGHLKVNALQMDAEQTARYRAVYCGICSELRKLGGLRGSIALQYDLVLLSMVLSSMYEPEQKTERIGCPRHPVKGVTGTMDEWTVYSARVGMLLSWLKVRDDVEDEGGLGHKAALGLLDRGYRRAGEQMPQLRDFIEKKLDELSQVEKQQCREPDVPAGIFAEIMAEIFAPKEGYWTPVLRQLGFSLGRYLYLLDACLDLEEDDEKGR